MPRILVLTLHTLPVQPHEQEPEPEQYEPALVLRKLAMVRLGLAKVRHGLAGEPGGPRLAELADGHSLQATLGPCDEPQAPQRLVEDSQEEGPCCRYRDFSLHRCQQREREPRQWHLARSCWLNTSAGRCSRRRRQAAALRHAATPWARWRRHCRHVRGGKRARAIRCRYRGRNCASAPCFLC